MHVDYKISREEKKFLIANCPLKIHRNSFKKVYFFCMAIELKTKREILFYSLENDFVKPEDIGNLIILVSGLDSDVIIIFARKESIGLTQSIEWLNKNSNKEFILIFNASTVNPPRRCL